MGQAEPGKDGRDGKDGKPGVGIQFVTWNSTTGQMLITKTDNTQLPPLEVKGIQGPMGPPGNYTPNQVAEVITGDTTFISSVSANLATQQQLSTNLATELSKENLYPLFKSKVSDNLSANNQFKQSISDNLKRDDGFKGYVSNELGTLVSTDIGKLVSPKTIWCNDSNLCSLPTTGTLNIPTGYNSEGAGATGQPIQFSFKADGGFKHFIRTRHNAVANSEKNAFDFYVNNSTDKDTSSAPGTGNKNIMSIHARGVNVNGDINANVTGNGSGIQVNGDNNTGIALNSGTNRKGFISIKAAPEALGDKALEFWNRSSDLTASDISYKFLNKDAGTIMSIQNNGNTAISGNLSVNSGYRIDFGTGATKHVDNGVIRYTSEWGADGSKDALHIVGGGPTMDDRQIILHAGGRGVKVGGPLVVNGRNILNEIDEIKNTTLRTDRTVYITRKGNFCYTPGDSGQVWCDGNHQSRIEFNIRN